MTSVGLSDQIGLVDREVVAIVGAGGKSTILFTLGEELAARNSAVVLTTTTRMGADQPAAPCCWTDDPAVIAPLLEPGKALFVGRSITDTKVHGLAPGTVDRLMAETHADHVIVEADGARSMEVKAPADHEPVVPTSTTTVVAVASLDAIGHPIADVAHRPQIVASLLGTGVDHLIAPEDIAAIVGSKEGGLKNVPPHARVVVALTKMRPSTAAAARSIVAMAGGDRAIERVVSIPAH